MANWKARVRSAKKADRRVLNQQLEEIRQEAATAGRDLRFLFESNGRKMDIDPQATVESLTDVERHYRAVARDSGVSPEDLAMIERLMALLLGETLIRARGGRWDVYDGQFRTASPFVVTLEQTGKHFDAAVIAQSLHRKHSLDGAAEGEALAKAVAKADALAF